jgi:hypothetical protein
MAKQQKSAIVRAACQKNKLSEALHVLLGLDATVRPPHARTHTLQHTAACWRNTTTFTSTNFQTFNFELVFSEFYFCIFVPRENDTDEHDTSLATQVRR